MPKWNKSKEKYTHALLAQHHKYLMATMQAKPQEVQFTHIKLNSENAH